MIQSTLTLTLEQKDIPEAVRREALRRRVSVAQLLKEKLLNMAAEITAEAKRTGQPVKRLAPAGGSRSE